MFGRFMKNKAGNLSLTTALMMAPLIGVIGVAVDIGNAQIAKNRMQIAADAAAIGAIAEKSAGTTNSYDHGDDELSDSENDSLKLFSGEMDNIPGVTVQSVSVDVKKRGTVLSSSLTYSGSIPTTFSKIFGQKTISFSGKATAEFATQTFRDFYLLLDNTPSMGVGATTADINKLVANTPDQCAFACHIVADGVENTNDYYNLAKKLGVTTRIDVLAQATASLMDTAKQRRTVSNQYRMAIYTFGEKAEDIKLLEVAPLTVDLDDAKKKAAGVQLMTIPRQGYDNDQQTSFDTALTQIKDKIGKPGNGSSSQTPEKVVFFVADGVGDSYKPTSCTKKTTGGRCMEPIDVQYCTALKTAGYKVAVLYTTYLPLPTNGWYNAWVKPFQSEIATKMRSCASDGLFFEVSPTQGISDAMNTLFVRIISTPRLTG